MNYVKLLKEKMEKDGFTIPGKDLSNPKVCKGILMSCKAIEEGRAALMHFNDRHDHTPVFCSFCKEEIPQTPHTSIS